ncbi:MAG: S1-like domain-containing RNA-binding protein [bacterium]|nr:S1-like domain-containing RNA-binding protein [bacterium]
MADIGRYNTLKVLRLSPKGAHLEDRNDTGAASEILLPTRFVPEGTVAGSELEVFVYINAEDRVTATTARPAAQVGEVAWLKIVSVNDNGAFLDWGLPKDLLLPHNEVTYDLKPHLEPGKQMMVMVFQDEKGRVAASARLDDFIAKEGTGFAEGEKVSVLIGDRTEIGVRVIINNRYWGMVHSNEIFRPLRKGETLDGYIKTIREDRKLNVSLTAPGQAKVDNIAEGILKILDRHDGFMAVSDKTAPEVIYKLFGISKKVFKQAIGRLYKERYILIENSGIRRINNDKA